MLPIQGGTFWMGAKEEDKEIYSWEKPKHQVSLSDFYIGKYPVTQALWQEIMGDNPSRFKGQNHPVEQISWNQIVQEFLPKLNTLTEKDRPEGMHFRLPTEAEWEYAARGGIHSEGYLYAGGNKLEEVAWYIENSHRESKAIGLKLSNELGLYDMTGNVLEWCHDWFDSDYYEKCEQEGIVDNPIGAKSGTLRVLRGGSWNFNPQDCRLTYRNLNRPDDRFNFLGFRLVLSSLPV